MFVKFPSINRASTHGYLFTSEPDWHTVQGRILDRECQEFMTYGDNMCQHSHAVKVQMENFTDYCISFAKFLRSGLISLSVLRQPRGNPAERKFKMRFSSVILRLRRSYSSGNLR